MKRVLAVLLLALLLAPARAQTTVAVNVAFSAYWLDGTRCSCLVTLSHPDSQGNIITDFQTDTTNTAGKFTATLHLDPAVVYFVDVYSDFYQQDIVKAPANFPFPLSVKASLWMARPTASSGPALNTGQSSIAVTF